MNDSPISPNSHLSSDLASAQANAWILRHYDELVSRACACFSRLTDDRREEAVAEVLAKVLAWAISAARRGRLHRLTVYWAVVYAARHVRCGRRFVPTVSACVMSESGRAKRGVRVVSLDDTVCSDRRRSAPLRECLADRDAENPFDIVRRIHDYPDILDSEKVSEKANDVLLFLARTHGDGKQSDLAAELGLSAGRITQLKGQLRNALARHGYVGPLGPRPGGRMAA